MSWAATLPLAVACVALLLVPGGILATALGLRGLSIWAAAPVLTVSMSAITAIVCGKAGIAWTVLPLLVVALLASGVAWFIRRALDKRFGIDAEPWRFHVTPAGAGQFMGLAAGALLIGWQLVRVFSEPENISQTFDNVFHLNAVRYVLDTGDASSLTLTSMTNGDNPPYFYPAAWHGVVALAVQLTGAPLAASVNVFNIVVAALVWTLGCMVLTRTIVGDKPWIVGFSGILASCFSSFPILLLDFGVLYPNFLAIAMIPLGLAAVAVFFGVGTESKWHPLARYAVAPVAAIAIAIAHPNGAMTLVALSIPVAVVSYCRRYVGSGLWRKRPKETAAVTLGLLAAMAFVVLLWKVVRPPAEAAFWGPTKLPAGAVGEIITNSAMGRPAAWVLSALMLIGIYAAIRTRSHAWLLCCFAVTAVLFITVAGVERGYWRNVITGVWYNDSYRLAAILPITALPLAALGFGWLWQGIRRILDLQMSKRVSESAPRRGTKATFLTAAGILVIVLLTIPMQGTPMKVAVAGASHNYAENAESALVSTDELALINKLDDIVGPNEVIAASPWTGAAMAYALGDRRTTSMHTLSTYPRNVEIINNNLRDAETNPEVCPAVEATGVRYILDFGAREVHGDRHSFPGLENLQDSPAVELVTQVGEAKLYRLIAC
ncbi:hypothetical protein MB46_11460 [Arthrobacter alpinus]|uniref:DUF6541 family protein n=1 Tax=Arthrobacter alpinus TaxID=656366 RepID=UPI0005CB7D32|nr:DUF6541 family protein [Arthrobacter alpinus]ALV46006.1 hypothetical protein MB46_11460 [Arthrobacter alpinus]